MPNTGSIAAMIERVMWPVKKHIWVNQSKNRTQEYPEVGKCTFLDANLKVYLKWQTFSFQIVNNNIAYLHYFCNSPSESLYNWHRWHPRHFRRRSPLSSRTGRLRQCTWFLQSRTWTTQPDKAEKYMYISIIKTKSWPI